jgi:hypothetical protein
MVNLTPQQQQQQLRELPDAFFSVKGKWGEQGSTSVRLAAVDEETLGEALTLAWQNTVAKRRAARASGGSDQRHPAAAGGSSARPRSARNRRAPSRRGSF